MKIIVFFYLFGITLNNIFIFLLTDFYIKFCRFVIIKRNVYEAVYDIYISNNKLENA